LRQEASGIAGLDEGNLMGWREQNGGVKKYDAEFGNQWIRGVDYAST
jgi:hypothetical protein